ncbi:MAG TPA: Holliday junction resolvase RuvX [Candidatus Baltobacteraceae bacterium]|nr:Holliday junction resolvase RuvX [Candidatus Baltobacteraceae bacterium]
MGKALAVDWGTVRIGLAVSDELGMIARGLTSLPGGHVREAVEAIAQQVQALGVETVVVGLPRNLDGSDGPAATQARAFARALEARLGLPVCLWDERLTSVAAERLLIEGGVRRRQRKDAVNTMAARLILQGFLDRRRAAAAPAEDA